MTKDIHKTGNRKCWHVVDPVTGGAMAFVPLNMTRREAEKQLATRPILSSGQLCRDGYHLIPCPGQAHSNAHIDNCSQCAPRWGWVMVKDNP
jgi:hypothetical protein